VNITGAVSGELLIFSDALSIVNNRYQSLFPTSLAYCSICRFKGELRSDMHRSVARVSVDRFSIFFKLYPELPGLEDAVAALIRAIFGRSSSIALQV
jgi:hypothetical protein